MTRITGALIAVAGLVVWATAIALQPALRAAGLAITDRRLPAAFNSETHLVLLLDAHDLRLVALVVVMAGVALVVAGTPVLAARPAPVLVSTGGLLLVANLVWGLLPGKLLLVAGSTALLVLVAAPIAYRRRPPDTDTLRPGRALPGSRHCRPPAPGSV